MKTKIKAKKKKVVKRKTAKRVGPEYKAHPACKYDDSQAQEIGNNLEVIRRFHDGEVTPKEVLEFAADKGSQLYKYFEWNDTKAAYKYRVSQARYMLAHVYIVVDTYNGPQDVRAFINVSSEVDTGRRYTSVSNALTNENYRGQVISGALREVRKWQNKHRQYKELAPIFKAIDGLDL